MKSALLDAGPIVGYLRADDRHHQSTVAAFERCAAAGLALVTTWEAVSEAFTVVRMRVRGGQGKALVVLDWAWDSGIRVFASEAGDHRRCRALLERHRDVALSHADALLLAIGERLDAAEVLTIDGAHFPAVKLRSATIVTVLD